jgi:hypothetical protein
LRDADLRLFGVAVDRVPTTVVCEHPEQFLLVVRRALECR